jgi:hypothetical protein
MPFLENVLTDESCQEGWRDHSAQDASQSEGYACAGVLEFRREGLRGQDWGQAVQKACSEKCDEKL